MPFWLKYGVDAENGGLYNCPDRTGKGQYMDILDKVVDYAFSPFSDRAYGEWYGYLRRDGKPTEPPCKGHTYKGPFHVMRMLSKCIVMLEQAGY